VQVVIVGGGPAGSLLGNILQGEGIDTVVLERRSREYVLGRIRAGVLEQVAAELLRSEGLASRLDHQGLVHGGITISDEGHPFHVPFRELTGRTVIVYGQTELQKDLYDAADRRNTKVVFEAEVEEICDIDSPAPVVTYRTGGTVRRVRADYVVGCDGAHGVSRRFLPRALVQTYERVYPFGWLGVMSETPPVHEELIYARSDRGFALCSMRNPMLSRYYVQCRLEDRVEEWPDERFWTELRHRIPEDAAERLVIGRSIEKSITPLRSQVIEPMQFDRLFLAGDAAHIVPPTGAKGLNLALSDVAYLSHALLGHYKEKDDSDLKCYSKTALRRVWKATRFSWWMTTVLHRFPEDGAFARRLQKSELDYLRDSQVAQTALAENYVGLPY